MIEQCRPDDPLLLEIKEKGEVSWSGKNKAMFSYEDDGKKFGAALLIHDAEHVFTEAAVRDILAPGIWRRVVVTRQNAFNK